MIKLVINKIFMIKANIKNKKFKNNLKMTKT